MGALLEDVSNDNEVLARLKQLAIDWLPNGWKEWQVVQDNNTQEFEVDQQTLNKLRFALPTVGIAKAFKPHATSLMEKPYRDMKVQMLKWSFCRGLVISPPDLAIKIRGSALQNELVIQATAPLRHLFISRKEASVQLSDDQSDVEELENRKRRRSSSVSSSKKSRLDELESRQERIEELLQELVGRRQKHDEESSAEEGGGGGGITLQ